MKKSIEEIQILHRAGRLDEAKSAYLEYLNTHPDDVTALHMLGILYAEEGKLDTAQSYLERALRRKSDDPVLFLHLANILKAQGLFDRAAQVLLDLIQLRPDFAAAFNNLGTVYFAQQKWEDAVKTFQTAIDIQSDYVDAYYNLGLALIRAKQRNAALNTWQALIELAPTHPGARFQLGRLMMEEGQFKSAIEHFSAIEKEHPFHFETLTNLATCFLRLGKLNEAKLYYLQALDLVATDVQVLFNLGVISTQQGKIDEAIDFYLRAVKQNPDFYEAHNNLGAAYLAIKHTDTALLHFRESLRIHPDNQAVRHTIDILMHKRDLPAAPPEYISSLFDSYADHYDSHLTEALHYQVPECLYQAVVGSEAVPPNSLDILDLGCGTGLCGEKFKNLARTLTGVDLSAQMLVFAKQKSIYSDLIQSDILTYLQNCQRMFNLIVAGDVLVYYGDLALVFAAAAQVLTSGGLFGFNAEMSKEDYVMTASGRFAHNKTYLDKLAAANDFEMVMYKVITMRTQNEAPVSGHLYLLRFRRSV